MEWLLMILLASASPGPGCPRTLVLPPDLKAWARPVAGSSDELRVGVARQVDLKPVGAVRWASPPERTPPGNSRGIAFKLRVASAGTYRVALADPAWIDLVGAGGVVRSVAHRHGPDCSGIRKIVDFALSPGVYRVQLSGMPVSATRILVVPR